MKEAVKKIALDQVRAALDQAGASESLLKAFGVTVAWDEKTQALAVNTQYKINDAQPSAPRK